jgi:hypothetical protein
VLIINVALESNESFDDAKNEFVTVVTRSQRLQLEHSLVSLSKWESNWEKPFLSSDDKSNEEILWYVRAMVVGSEIPEEVFAKLSDEDYEAINAYINKKMTATWFTELPNQPQSKEVMTAELIYYLMIAMNIPAEFQYWHLNRLLTLIRVCSVKNAPPKKMSRRELAEQQRRLNAERKARFGTSG